jgi:hypothetical protein
MTTRRCKCCGTERPSKKARLCRVCKSPALWREETAQERQDRSAQEARRPDMEALLQVLLSKADHR